MKYEAFSKKILKEIRKKVFDNRIDETEVFRTKFKKRFTVELSPIRDFNGRPELLCFEDIDYNISNSQLNLYHIFLRMQSGELTKQGAIDLALEKSEEKVQELIVAAQHYFDKLNAQEAYDKEHGLITNYDDWFGL